MEDRILALWDKIGTAPNEAGPILQSVILLTVGGLLLLAVFTLASNFIGALYSYASRETTAATVQAQAQIAVAQAKAQADREVAYYNAIAAQSMAIGKSPTALPPKPVAALQQFLKLDGKPSDLAHGYIYVIKSAGAYKIGKAKNVQDRLNQLKTGNEAALIVVHCIATNAMNRAESMLHQHYAKHRGNGEWFNLTEQDVLNLKSIWRIDVKGLPTSSDNTTRTAHTTPSIDAGASEETTTP